MNAELPRGPRLPLPGGASVAVDRQARVVAVKDGLVVVRTRGQVVRAGLGGALLARVAADPDARPRPGDRVRLRVWNDGALTVERVVVRPV